MVRASAEAVRAFLARPDRVELRRSFSAAAVRRFPPVATASDAAAPDATVASAAAAAPPPPRASAGASVKVEVGSGTGDWVVLQAAAEPQTRWVALELRCDRACLILAKAAMQGLQNLEVIAGDAASALSGALPSRGVEEVHVHFPQPPPTETSERHMLNHDFLAAAHRVLRPGGSLALTTDDERFCARFAADLAGGAAAAATVASVASAAATAIEADDADTATPATPAVQGAARGRPVAAAHTLWQPAVVALPHYKAVARAPKRARSAFDELWAARGFTRRFTCRFMSRRAREPESVQSAAAARSAAAAPSAAAAVNGVEGAGAKRKRKKETSQQRKKRRAQLSEPS